LHNATVKTLTDYQGDPTAARLKDWEAAREALRRKVESVTAPDIAPHANLLALVRHLADQGYKVKKSKVYKDAKEGRLRVAADGTISDEHARIYAATLVKVADRAGDIEAGTLKKQSKEIERLTLQNEKLRFDLEQDRKVYVRRTDMETDLALRCAVLEAGLKHTIQSRMQELVRVVDGKTDRCQAAVDLLFGAVDGLLNDYARAEAVEVEA